MWRTYGRDENTNEAAGCCLVLDIDFFDKRDGGHLTIKKDDDSLSVSHPLYQVLYYNQRDKLLLDDPNETLKKLLDKLKRKLTELLHKRNGSGERDIAIERILYHSLSELRFFFKSTDYAYENELRVMQFAADPKTVKIDTSDILPRKMFIESSKTVIPRLKKIVLGPKVQHPDKWMYLLEEMKRKGYKMEILKSTCRFQ